METTTTRRYIPRDLHFPLVASRLEWTNLPIIDWPDIDPRSREYAFLKEIGVKEVPELYKLIGRIQQEHDKQSKKINEYKIPVALTFFAEHFQQHYSKLWKDAQIKVPFLPSSTSEMNSPSEVILLTPNNVFKGLLQLFPDYLERKLSFE